MDKRIQKLSGAFALALLNACGMSAQNEPPGGPDVFSKGVNPAALESVAAGDFLMAADDAATKLDFIISLGQKDDDKVKPSKFSFQFSCNSGAAQGVVTQTNYYGQVAPNTWSWGRQTADWYVDANDRNRIKTLLRAEGVPGLIASIDAVNPAPGATEPLDCTATIRTQYEDERNTSVFREDTLNLAVTCDETLYQAVEGAGPPENCNGAYCRKVRSGGQMPGANGCPTTASFMPKKSRLIKSLAACVTDFFGTSAHAALGSQGSVVRLQDQQQQQQYGGDNETIGGGGSSTPPPQPCPALWKGCWVYTVSE